MMKQAEADGDRLSANSVHNPLMIVVLLPVCSLAHDYMKYMEPNIWKWKFIRIWISKRVFSLTNKDCKFAFSYIDGFPFLTWFLMNQVEFSASLIVAAMHRILLVWRQKIIRNVCVFSAHNFRLPLFAWFGWTPILKRLTAAERLFETKHHISKNNFEFHFPNT